MRYEVPMPAPSYRALAWIAERYTSGEVLYRGSEYDDETETLYVPEHVAWAYLDALPEDNGNPDQIVPPCAGGNLAEALAAFHEAIA